MELTYLLFILLLDIPTPGRYTQFVLIELDWKIFAFIFHIYIYMRVRVRVRVRAHRHTGIFLDIIIAYIRLET